MLGFIKINYRKTIRCDVLSLPYCEGSLSQPSLLRQNSTVLLGIVKWYYSHADGGTHVIAGLWSSGFYQFGEGALGLKLLSITQD